MRILIGILLFITLTDCSNKQADKVNVNQTDNFKSILISDFSVIDSKFPLVISAIDFKDSTKIIQLNDGINSTIERTISDYYFNECSGDSAGTYFSMKDIYLKTIRLHDSIQTIFVILLKHMPDGLINSKILFYNNNTKLFNDKVIDFNLHALYNLENGRLTQTNLKEQFKITAPEIELVNDKPNRTNDYKFTRLYHNGTANAIETAILQVTENSVDTLEFKQKWIQ